MRKSVRKRERESEVTITSETDIIAKHVVTLFLFWLRKQTQERRTKREREGERKESQKSRATTTTSWVKTADSRFVAAAQNNSSRRRRSKITTKATSGGPTRLAERFGGKGETDREKERQQDTVIGEKDRYDHAKNTQTAGNTIDSARERSNEWACKRQRRTNRHRLSGCRSPSLSLSFVWLYGCEAHTHTSPTSRRLLTCFCGGQSEKRG